MHKIFSRRFYAVREDLQCFNSNSSPEYLVHALRINRKVVFCDLLVKAFSDDFVCTAEHIMIQLYVHSSTAAAIYCSTSLLFIEVYTSVAKDPVLAAVTTNIVNR